MALLNYTGSYSNISSYLNATASSLDWLRIFVSPDSTGGGHFITHGIDFGASYANGQRGLVPGNSGTLNKTFLRGDGWAALWTSAAETAAAVGDTDAQKLAAKEAYLQSTIASVYDIKQWIAQSFIANNSMRFKGTINIDGTGAISNTTEGGTTNGFPTSCEVGDTYKISGNSQGSSSYIAGEPVSTGDMVICIKAGSGASLNNSQYWTVVQDNVEHLITYTLNGTAYKLYAQTGTDITLFAPATAGTTGQVLVSNGSGNAPGWVNQNTLVVAQAGKVTYALVKSTGITMTNQGSAENSYDGSKTITIGLANATTSTIGGVIVDGGTHSEAYNASTNTSNTPYPTISVSSGEIYLTKQNVINALGFTPGNSTGSISKVVVASAANGNANTTSATSNPYVNIVASDNSVLGSFRISGSGKIGVKSTANSAALVVSLAEADSSNYGGIKIGYTTSGKNYAVQLSSGKAYVNVPWVSDVFTASANGLAPAASDANKSESAAASTTYLLGADAKWYKLPSSAFQGDRRIVKANGTTIIAASSGNALNIIAGNHLNIAAAQSSGSYTGAVTFDVVWRDIQVHTVSGSSISQNVASIGSNDPLVFENSESVFMLGEEITVGSGANATKKTVVKSYITWYNLDTGEYEII